MPNSLTALGLETATRDEWISYFTTQFQTIYGPDINLASDTPDGQMVNIITQNILDLQDLLVQIYSSMSPDNAVGVVLDQRVAINGIQRQAGTYTVTDITLVTSQSVNLYGLDQTAQEIYTVSDNAGNLWQLQTTHLGVSAGTNVFSFQAAVPGANLTIPNTINVPVTIVLGVVSVNNPTIYTTLGINEESDAVLKVRRQKSVSLASQGYLTALLAALENINGVSSAFVYENTTGVTNGDGVPGHSIWVIVAGTGADADIARAIYTKRNAGCGMFGTSSYTITQIDGSPFVVLWDTVIQVPVFISFTASAIDGVTPPNIAAIQAGITAQLIPGVNQEININQLATLVQSIDTNCLVTSAGFSSGKLQTLNLSAVPASGAFTLSYNGVTYASILYNATQSTIQATMSGGQLAGVVVTGDALSQAITFDLTNAAGGVLDLLKVSANSLLTAGSAAITFTYNEHYANTLSPPTKRNQFAIQSSKIIIIPMQLSPSSSQVVHGGSKQFTGLGGYGTLVYSISINNSGGSINASTGLYTAGATPSVVDTVKVADGYGNSAIALVTVT